VDPERLFATNGVTGGLALLCSLFTTAGDTIAVEEPSYFLALNIFRELGLNLDLIPIDKDGMDVDALEARCRTGHVPKALYTVPTFHNPTGYTMSHARREKLAALAEEFGFVVFADEVYQLLGFEGSEAPPPCLCTYDHSESGRIISLGSFSKILAPSLRLGWYEAHPALLAKVYGCGQLDSSGGINPFVSGIVQSALDMGLQDVHLAEVKAELTRRANKLCEELEKHLPEGCSFEPPRGGYFVWIKIPDGVDAPLLLAHAAHNHKVRFLPGTKFGSAELSNRIRLSISFYPSEGIEVGAARVGDAIRTYIENGGPVGGDDATKAAAGSR
jgi:2-aminoadipate transaminase